MFPRMGTVTGVDPKRYAAKVELQPEGVETGWLPVGAVAIGNGWGIATLPALGDQVVVHFLDGDIGSGVVGHVFYSRADAPMVAAKAGEFWLVHKSGSKLRFLEDGQVEIVADGALSVQAGSTVDIVASGRVHITGADCLITGNLGVQGTIKATGDIDANQGSVP